jgi:hypothetical protein
VFLEFTEGRGDNSSSSSSSTVPPSNSPIPLAGEVLGFSPFCWDFEDLLNSENIFFFFFDFCVFVCVVEVPCSELSPSSSPSPLSSLSITSADNIIGVVFILMMSLTVLEAVCWD